MEKKLDANLTVESNIKNWVQLKQLIESTLIGHKIKKNISNKVILSCEEIFSNICFYSYENVGNVFFEIFCCDKFIKVSFIDSGVEFDPTKFEHYRSTEKIKNRIPGGLGIFIAKQNVDDMKYLRKDNKNILYMIKNLGSDDFEQ